MGPVNLISDSLRHREVPASLRYDEQLLDARLGLTKIFRLVSDRDHVLHTLLNPAHGAPLERGCASIDAGASERAVALRNVHFDGLPPPLRRAVASASFRPSAMPAATARAITSLISPASPISKPNSLRIKCAPSPDHQQSVARASLNYGANCWPALEGRISGMVVCCAAHAPGGIDPLLKDR